MKTIQLAWVQILTGFVVGLLVGLFATNPQYLGDKVMGWADKLVDKAAR